MSGQRATRVLFTCLVVLSPGLGAPVATAAQTPAEEISRLETRFAAAREDAVHLLAPRAFDEALDRLRDVRRRAEGGAPGDELRERLREAEASLSAARAMAESGRELFAAALVERAVARDADAPQRAPQAWETAEAELREGGRRLEREDREEAGVRAERAAELYRRAAEAARRDRLLGAAIQARQHALSLGAEQLAPATFAAGEQALALAESRIRGGGPDAETASAGEDALTAFQRAAGVAALADSVLRRRVPVERLVLAHEADLSHLAQIAGLVASGGDTDGTTVRIAAEVTRLQEEVVRLESELADAGDEMTRLSRQLADVRSELEDAERRYADARAELLSRRARDDRLLEASALFSPEEGEVFVTGDRLTIRLYGLTFESGSDEILEEHHVLLTKVEQVITAFEGALVRIEGHTDSQGRPESNQTLSQRRAIAVREHLLTRLPIPSSRFEAVGLGEERPIASNESEEGRARNRRIEIVLTLTG